MSLPTLFKPGNILAQKWMTRDQKKEAVTAIPIEWIINYLIDRCWDKRIPPKIKIKSPLITIR